MKQSALDKHRAQFITEIQENVERSLEDAKLQMVGVDVDTLYPCVETTVHTAVMGVLNVLAGDTDEGLGYHIIPRVSRYDKSPLDHVDISQKLAACYYEAINT